MNDDTSDTYDPVIAERFEALDGLPVPELDLGLADQVSPAAPMRPRRSIARSDPRLLLAAAAVVAVVGVGIAYATVLRSDPPDVVAASESAPTDENQPFPSTDPSADVAPGRSDEDTTTTEERTATTSTAPSTTSTTAEDTSADPEDPTRDPTDEAPPVTSTTTTAPPSTTSTTSPETSTPPAGQEVTITGLVTQVFTDCGTWLVLNDSGEVEERGPITCDGGSYLVVDDTRIRTSAGYVADDAQYYDRHPGGLSPGSTVSVTAVADERGELTLACDRCSVSIQD